MCLQQPRTNLDFSLSLTAASEACPPEGVSMLTLAVRMPCPRAGWAGVGALPRGLGTGPRPLRATRPPRDGDFVCVFICLRLSL